MEVDFNRDVYCLLGLPFDRLSEGDVISRIRAAAHERRFCFLSTPNLNFAVGCRSNVGFRQSILNSDLSIPDGMPLVWIARLLGVPISQRVSGSGIFEALQRDARSPLNVYFFGGAPGVGEAAAARLNAGASGLRCVGFDSPGFVPIEAMSSDETLARINNSGADFLVVALGAQKGQAWIEHNRARILVPVISHLGAVVNFVAGTVERAPVWMQQSGLEWLWRIRAEPGLWRRYWSDGWVFLRVLFGRVLPYALSLRCRRKTAAATVVTIAIESGNNTVIVATGNLNKDKLGRLRECFGKAAARDADVELDLGAVLEIDSAVVGQVALLYGHQQARGRRLMVAGLRPEVRRVFSFLSADYLLDN